MQFSGEAKDRSLLKRNPDEAFQHTHRTLLYFCIQLYI